jgi:hypothetical protein
MVDAAAARWAPSVVRDAGEDDSDTYIVGVCESPDPDAWSLIFMECDEDKEPGMDTYCLVVHPGEATCYGGVVECELRGSDLRLRLTEEAAETLGTPTDLRFTLVLDSAKVQMLGRGLSRVLTSGRPDAVPRRLAI